METLAEQNRKHQSNHRNKLKALLGDVEYKKQQAEYMREYRANRKGLEQTKPIMPIKSVVIPTLNITPTQKQQKGLKYKVDNIYICMIKSINNSESNEENNNIDNPINITIEYISIDNLT